MEDNFRNALIIISAIIIAAIFIHGLWTIRKNKNPYKLKASHDKVEPLNRDFDRSGFDQDGVSEVRVVKTALTGEIDNPPADEEIPNQPAPAPEYHDEPLPVDMPKEAEPVVAQEGQPVEIPAQETLETEQPVESVIEEKPVYQEPVIQAKPTAAKPKASSLKPKETKKEALKRNQIELNFDDSLFDEPKFEEPSINEPHIGEANLSTERKEPTLGGEAQTEQTPEIETEVIVVSVVMPEGHLMSGAALLPSLLTLGMKYGDMNIFHRHQDNAGNGKVTFSLANMMNPGTFDLDNMENFVTQGISMFMTLPNAGDPFEVFEQMMGAAKHLAQEFNAQVLDDKRSVMTKQTEQHYVGKIREFERKSRIAHA